MMRHGHRGSRARIVGVVLVGAWLAGCGVTLPEEEPTIRLRTYQVPAESRDELQRMLQSALDTGGSGPIARVTAGPGGTLLVAAPPSIQEGVQRTLDAGFEAPPPALPVTIDYWLLVGRALGGGEAGDVAMVPGRAAPPLESVMEEIASAQGPTEFALLEQAQLTSLEQENATATGAVGRFHQRVTRIGGRVVAEIAISSLVSPNGLQTRVTLERDQFVVLGQVGFGGVPGASVFAEATDGEVVSLYYVIRADFE